MKLFRSVRKSYKAMGIYPLQSNRNCSINRRNLFFSMSYFLLFASTMGYFLFESTDLIERSETLYVSLTELACINNFVITAWKMVNFHMFIDRIEEFIKKSKFRFQKFSLSVFLWEFFSLDTCNRIKC